MVAPRFSADFNSPLSDERPFKFHTFPRYPYGAIVAIAPFGLLVTHQGAGSNGSINM